MEPNELGVRYPRLSLTLAVLACLASLIGAVTGMIALQRSSATDRKTEQLSEQAVALQQKEFQSEQVQLTLRPRIELAAADGSSIADYPGDLPSGSRDVPEDELSHANTIWLIGDLSNTGGRAATIREWGLGVSRTNWEPVDASNLQCATGADESHWQTCASAYSLQPGHEVEFAFTASMSMLRDVAPAWRGQGLELCVKMEAYGIYCDHTTARVLATSTTPPASRGRR